MRDINAFEVHNVICFEPGERPVFALTFRNREKLVVKFESRGGSGRSSAADSVIPIAGKLMKQVSPQIKAKILTGVEMSQLAIVSKNIARFGGKEESRKYLELYATDREAATLFSAYKMPFFENVTDFKKLAKEDGLPLLLLQLDHEALHELGKIVAVDLFNGNEDRFNGKGEVANAGNLLFQSSNGKLTPLGLDFYEAQGYSSNLSVASPKDQWKNNGEGKLQYRWPGLTLQSEAHMRVYAAKCIIGLNTEFQRLQPAGGAALRLLGRQAEVDFGNGVVRGGQQLRQFLSTRGGLPSGVLERMNRLGWHVPPRPSAQTPPAPSFVGSGRQTFVQSFRRGSVQIGGRNS